MSGPPTTLSSRATPRTRSTSDIRAATPRGTLRSSSRLVMGLHMKPATPPTRMSSSACPTKPSAPMTSHDATKTPTTVHTASMRGRQRSVRSRRRLESSLGSSSRALIA